MLEVLAVIDGGDVVDHWLTIAIKGDTSFTPVARQHNNGAKMCARRHTYTVLTCSKPWRGQPEESGMNWRCLQFIPIVPVEIAKLVGDRRLHHSPPAIDGLGIDASNRGDGMQLEMTPDM